MNPAKDEEEKLPLVTNIVGVNVNNDPKVFQSITDLIHLCVGDKCSELEIDLTRQLIQTSLKLITEGHDIGQLKLMSRALKEMRYAYRIFNQYSGVHRVSIFGSARTPEDHPDYIAARAFSQGMADMGWMCITGAANGIMKAGLEGSKKESSFGLSIRLPFESGSNTVIEGDPKLIIFRYFFTRKLMFLSHSEAVAVFPGGFGTQDELFEVLTLIQTGKTNVMPVVLIEGAMGNYWQHWEHYVHKRLLNSHWISEEDQNLYYLAPTVEAAVEHVKQFYKRFHSYRYVKNKLIIRLKSPITEEQLDLLNDKYSTLVLDGRMEQCKMFPEENQLPELPRLVFEHTRKHIGLLRALIDQINAF